MTAKQKRWSWYGQTLDAVLAVTGLVVVGAMVYRWSFPINGLLLAFACFGGLSASQVIDALVGRYSRPRNGGSSSDSP